MIFHTTSTGCKVKHDVKQTARLRVSSCLLVAYKTTKRYLMSGGNTVEMKTVADCGAIRETASAIRDMPTTGTFGFVMLFLDIYFTECDMFSVCISFVVIFSAG